MTRASYLALAFSFFASSGMAQTAPTPPAPPAPAKPAAPAPPPAPPRAGAQGTTPPAAPAPPATPTQATPPAAPAAAPGQAPSEAPPSSSAAPAYYFEPPSAEGAEPENEAPNTASSEASKTSPPPHYGPRFVWEPPPPPTPRHTAPRSSFWLGGRVGWFIPFGNAFAVTVDRGTYRENVGVRFRDYASSGPLFEIDIGARLGRHYNVFGLWERAELGSGRGDLTGLNTFFGELGRQTGGDTDFWAAAVRISSDPDDIGLVSELALGYRRARMGFESGEKLELTNGSFEARIGVGADIRVNRRFSLSPMLTLGVGVFGQADLVRRNGNAVDLFRNGYDGDGHGWFTLHLGGHFDLAGRH